MNKWIFLDRDGVINQRYKNGYVTCWEEFVFLPGVCDALRRLSQAGYRNVVVSNQAGVAKGFYARAMLDHIDQNMCAEVARQGGKIEASYYCIHRDEDVCACRKPKPGLLHMAEMEHHFSAAGAWMIGDSERDIVAGKAVGCRAILLSQQAVSQTQADVVSDTLSHAVDIVLAANEKDALL